MHWLYPRCSCLEIGVYYLHSCVGHSDRVPLFDDRDEFPRFLDPVIDVRRSPLDVVGCGGRGFVASWTTLAVHFKGFVCRYWSPGSRRRSNCCAAPWTASIGCALDCPGSP